MARFLDSHKMGSFVEEQLMELQKSPPDVFGVRHHSILYNEVTYCLLEAPSKEAVDMNHAKLNCGCDWITEVKTAA
jgi:hypothetical protein